MTFSKKMASAFLSFLLMLIPLFQISVYADEERSSILAVLCKNESEYLTLTEYDEIEVVLKNTKTNKTYSQTFYGYNGFSGKMTIPEGDYVVSDIYINGRYDAIIINEGLTVTSKYDYVVSLVIPLRTIAEVEPDFFETTTVPTTAEPTTVVNPFENPSVSENNNLTESNTQPYNPHPTTTENSVTSNVTFPNASTDINESSTNATLIYPTEDDGSETSDKTYLFVVITLILLIIAVIICIALKKRNNDE